VASGTARAKSSYHPVVARAQRANRMCGNLDFASAASDPRDSECIVGRKLSGFHGGISPVCVRQRSFTDNKRVYREQSADPQALVPVCLSSNQNESIKYTQPLFAR
jgi:hypothetical protein